MKNDKFSSGEPIPPVPPAETNPIEAAIERIFVHCLIEATKRAALEIDRNNLAINDGKPLHRDNVGVLQGNHPHGENRLPQAPQAVGHADMLWKEHHDDRHAAINDVAALGASKPIQSATRDALKSLLQATVVLRDDMEIRCEVGGFLIIHGLRMLSGDTFIPRWRIGKQETLARQLLDRSRPS